MKTTEGGLRVDWKKIKAEYIAGGTSYRKLVEKYGVSLTTLQRIAKKEDWQGLRQQAEIKTNTKIVNSICNQQARTAIKINDVADKLLEKIEAVAETVSDPDSIKKLTSAIKDLKDIKGIKSDADMREQEARINKLRKDAEREDDTTNEIEIVFNAGEEAWNE
jgi:vacuolar-type H+-ATPase subunit I/STV1